MGGVGREVLDGEQLGELAGFVGQASRSGVSGMGQASGSAANYGGTQPGYLIADEGP